MAKKKKPRSRGTPRSVDPNVKRQERLAAKREERARAQREALRRERRERLVRGAVIAALVVAAFWFFFLRTATPDALGGHPIEKLSDAGSNQHTDQEVSYEETPPVAGAHSPSAAACGVYAEQIPDENYVHALEHGAVAVLYDPARVTQDDIRSLEAIVSDHEDRTISAPYESMDQAIYVTSWGERMGLESVDASAIREYIDTFRGKGPEGVDCPNTADDPFQAPKASPSPTKGGG